MTTTNRFATLTNQSLAMDAPSLKATASIKILLNDPELWKDLEEADQQVIMEEEGTESDDDDDTEFRLSGCDLLEMPTLYRGYTQGSEGSKEVTTAAAAAAASSKSLASFLRKPSPAPATTMRRMTSIRTFDSIAFEENNNSSSKKSMIWKRDSTIGLGLHLSEEDEERSAAENQQPFSIFSKNINFLQDLAKEATDNMEKTVMVLREEPNRNVLKAIVQSKFDCLGRNMGTLSSMLKQR